MGTSETYAHCMSAEFNARPSRLEDQLQELQHEFDARLEVIEERRADDEAEAIATERIRIGAAEHAQDGAEVLAELGIATH